MYDLNDIRKYIFRDAPEGLIVDTNLLILFLIGKYDIDLVENCRLTSKYHKDDYELLCRIMQLFKKLIITPHIVAEISNLSKNELKDQKLAAYVSVFINFLNTPSLEEKYVGIEKFFGVEIKLISYFGFTDMAIYELSKDSKLPFITDDDRFYQFSCNKTPCIKFQHIKNASLNSIFAKK